MASDTHKYAQIHSRQRRVEKRKKAARRRRRSADVVVVASANPERAWKELSVSSPEVVARISQAKREFATYQRRRRLLAAARRPSYG